MTDYQGLATLVTAGTASVVTLVTLWRVGHVVKASEKVRADILQVGADIKTVELATNSMKDALVKATAAASQAQGRAEGIAEERANPQRPVTPA